jgi:hypothetical protein
MLVARIVIERRLYEDGGDVIWSEATDMTDEGGLPLITTLGMLEMAKDTAIRDRMAGDS